LTPLTIPDRHFELLFRCDRPPLFKTGWRRPTAYPCSPFSFCAGFFPPRHLLTLVRDLPLQPAALASRLVPFFQSFFSWATSPWTFRSTIFAVLATFPVCLSYSPQDPTTQSLCPGCHPLHSSFGFSGFPAVPPFCRFAVNAFWGLFRSYLVCRSEI